MAKKSGIGSKPKPPSKKILVRNPGGTHSGQPIRREGAVKGCAFSPVPVTIFLLMVLLACFVL